MVDWFFQKQMNSVKVLKVKLDEMHMVQ